MAQQHPDPADVLARHLRARATEFLRALRLHRGAATPEDSAEAARALRRAARRISAGLYTFQPVLDPAWSQTLGPELAWVSGTLSQEDACTTRLDRLLHALHRLSGPTPPSPRRPSLPTAPPDAARHDGTAPAAPEAPGRAPAPGPAHPRTPTTHDLTTPTSHTTGAPTPPDHTPTDTPPTNGPTPSTERTPARTPHPGTPADAPATTAPTTRAPRPAHPRTPTADAPPTAHDLTAPTPRPASHTTGTPADAPATTAPATPAKGAPSDAPPPARAAVPRAAAVRRSSTATVTATVPALDDRRAAVGRRAGEEARAAGPRPAAPRASRPAPDRGHLTVGAAKAGALLERQLTLARARAHSAVLDAFGSARFHAVADQVAVLASEVPLTTAAQSADLRPLADAARERLVDAVAALPLLTAGSPYNAEALTHGLSPDPAPHPQDAPWHQVRLLLRLHRYAREVLHPAAGDDPRLRAAGEALDRHRDAAEAAAAAAQAARTPRITAATAYALGVLHADQRHEVEAARYAFQRVWQTPAAGPP